VIAAVAFGVLAVVSALAHFGALVLIAAVAAVSIAWHRSRRSPRRVPLRPSPAARPPTIRAEVIRPGAQADARAHQLADLKADHARLAERLAAADAYVADLAELLADTQTELHRERARLAEARAQAADLERQLGEARASAEAAWDAAAERPPSPLRPRPEADAREVLLAAPLSGAHPLGGRHE
jgi:hypothetical protein